MHLEEYVKTRQINHNTVYKYRTQAICTYIVLFPMQIFLQMDLKLVCRLLHELLKRFIDAIASLESVLSIGRSSFCENLPLYRRWVGGG